MKTAKQLLQAYIDSSAPEAAALFAANGALELPYLADLGVEPRYEGPTNVGAFLSFLHEKMYPGFKFIDVKIYIDAPDQAFGEYTIHQKSGISGKLVHQRFFGHCTAADGKIDPNTPRPRSASMPYKADAALRPSGLIGPVTIVEETRP